MSVNRNAPKSPDSEPLRRSRARAVGRVILKLIGAVSGLFAVAAVGFGVMGVILALSSDGGGFVGEKGFYASALFLVSLGVIAIGAVSGIAAYVCWALLGRPRFRTSAPWKG